MTLPTLTPEQRAEALEKAAAARSQRARIKSELKSGELKLSEFFAASETDEVLGKMKVRALLDSPCRTDGGGQGHRCRRAAQASP